MNRSSFTKESDFVNLSSFIKSQTLCSRQERSSVSSASAIAGRRLHLQNGNCDYNQATFTHVRVSRHTHLVANISAEKLEQGTTVGDGRFITLHTLGRGSQGRTSEALHKSTGAIIALKQFSGSGATRWKNAELTGLEARILSGLDHPRLPHYPAHFEDGRSLYVAAEAGLLLSETDKFEPG